MPILISLPKKSELLWKNLTMMVIYLDNILGNHNINYSEFLAATISVHSILTHERLEAIFKQFDIENKNQITAENIRDAMTKLGKEVSDLEIEEIMRKHDVSGDKAISFEEFK